MPHLFGGLSLWERWHPKGVMERATLEKKTKSRLFSYQDEKTRYHLISCLGITEKHALIEF